MILMSIIILVIFAYFLGSISSAIIISRLMGLPDPRSEGSNNPGATNVLRLGGKKAAAIVLVVDVLKGVIPVVVGHLYLMHSFVLSLVGLAAIIGHIFPIYYQFKGGKGVATTLGVYFALNPFFGLFCTLVWLLSVKFCQYSSLSSLIMVAAAPFISLLFFHSMAASLPLVVIALLIAYQHKENIERLKNKTESKTNLFNKK